VLEAAVHPYTEFEIEMCLTTTGNILTSMLFLFHWHMTDII